MELSHLQWFLDILENGYRWNIFEKFVAFQETGNALNLLKYAREQGFDCNAYSLELDELRELRDFL